MSFVSPLKNYLKLFHIEIADQFLEFEPTTHHFSCFLFKNHSHSIFHLFFEPIPINLIQVWWWLLSIVSRGEDEDLC